MGGSERCHVLSFYLYNFIYTYLYIRTFTFLSIYIYLLYIYIILYSIRIVLEFYQGCLTRSMTEIFVSSMPKLVVANLDRWSALVPPEDPRARANAVAWRERWLVLANLIDDRHWYYTIYTRLYTDIYSKCLYITTIIHLLSDQDRFNSMSVSTIYYYAHYHTIAHLKILQSDVGDAVESLGRVSVISGLCRWSFNRHLRGRKKGYDGYDCALGTCLALWNPVETTLRKLHYVALIKSTRCKVILFEKKPCYA